jgi:hypothetical protein
MAKKKTQAEINAEIREAVELLKKQAEEQANISNSLEGYLDGLKRLKGIKQEEARLDKILNKLESEKVGLSGDDLKMQEKKIQLLKEQIGLLKKEGDVLADNLQKVNKGNLMAAKAAGGLVKTFAKLPDLADALRKKIKTLGIIDMDKAMKKSALSMGVLSKQSDGFRTSFKEASKYTNQLGIGIEELAKMQADYSEELGRNVMLGESGLKAISNIAAATNLGAEGAARLAADFENVGLSAVRTAEYTEQVMNDSHKLGLNASKVIKNISQNMKMLNKYNFKGGVKGLAKMAETASKLGVDMNMVSGMADKLFDIEGAVDMSAQLQVMGGAWAQLADPFKLMYMARNDMEGLMESMGKAAESSVHFNNKTKEFEISALEMHKLRKIAEQTGVSYEELAQAGKNAAKFTKIKSQMRFNMSKEEQEFIANTAKFNEQGKAEIEINGGKKLVSQLTSADKTALKAQIEEKANLETRAKQAQTFDDQVTNLINMLKTSALPLVEAINKKLMPKLQGLMDKMIKNGWLDKIGQFAEMIGNGIAKLVGVFVDNPIATAVGIGLAKIGSFLFEKASWIHNGYLLAKGFLAGTGGGSGGSGSLMDALTGGGGGGGGRRMGMGGKMMKGASRLFGGKNTMVGRGMRGMASGMTRGGGGMFGGMGKMGGGMLGKIGGKFGPMGGMGLGLLGGGLGMGADALRGGMDDPYSTGGKLLGIGGKAAEWAGMGAMFGPWGALIGGLAGAGKGIYDEYFSDEAKKRDELRKWGVHDGVFNGDFSKGRGVVQGGKITPIDNKDDLIAMKKGGPIHNSFSDNNQKTMKIEFGEIRFKFDELKVSAPGSPGTAIDLTKDPQFIRNITRMIHVETEKVVNGGKAKG